jgi:hypothetical protein
MAPEGAAICDNCDEILDASFLGEEEVTPVEGEKTDIGPAPKSKDDLRPPRLRRPPSSRGGWEPPKKPAVALPVERRPYLAPPPSAPAPSPVDEGRRTAQDLGAFFRSLTLPDRWAVGAAAALLAMLALPWRWTREDDDILGLVAAWPVALLGATIIGIIYVRASRANAGLDRNLRMAQVAASATAAIASGLFLPWASQSRSLHAAGKTVSIALSTPLIGAYLGLVCAIAALLASLPNLRD